MGSIFDVQMDIEGNGLSNLHLITLMHPKR